MGAVKGGSTAVHASPYPSATTTWFAFSSIGAPAFEEIAKFSIGLRIIAQAGPTGFNCCGYDFADSYDQPLQPDAADTAPHGAWRDPCLMQRFADIDVAKAGHDLLIKQQRLHRARTTGKSHGQICSRKIRAERFRAKRRESRKTIKRYSRNQIDRPESPRIVQSHCPVGRFQDQVVVLFDYIRIEPPPARHAEVKDHRVAAISIDQAIFRAAPKPGNHGSCHPLPEISRDWTAQIGTSGFHRYKPLPKQGRLKTAHGRFDFWKLRHHIAAKMRLRARQGLARGTSLPIWRIGMNEENVSFGYEDIAAEEKTARVGGVFSNVASSYDIMNDAMSGGMHRLWKDRFVRRVKPGAGETILDMAGGTGDIAFRLAKSGAAITVADINAEMLQVGRERAEKRKIAGLVWAQENAEELSFEDKSFDAYTIAFGIRNVTHIQKALEEAHRALKRGGRFFCLEFSTTLWPGFAEAYDLYSHKLVPKIGQVLAKDEDSYRYLIESIRRFPDMQAFKAMIEDAGFVQCKVEPMLGGLVAIHSGYRI